MQLLYAISFNITAYFFYKENIKMCSLIYFLNTIYF